MKKKTNHYLSYLLATLSMIFAIFLDQYTKLLAVENLKNQAPIDIIENVFQLHYLENRGAAFGILQNQKIFFVIIGIIILIVALFLFKNAARETFYSIANLSASDCIRGNWKYDRPDTFELCN